jgi:hypothetical protein
MIISDDRLCRGRATGAAAARGWSVAGRAPKVAGFHDAEISRRFFARASAGKPDGVCCRLVGATRRPPHPKKTAMYDFAILPIREGRVSYGLVRVNGRRVFSNG